MLSMSACLEDTIEFTNKNQSIGGTRPDLRAINIKARCIYLWAVERQSSDSSTVEIIAFKEV